MLSSDVFFASSSKHHAGLFSICFPWYGFVFHISSGTYLTNEAKGADDAPDADTAIINAEGNHAHAEEKKEYFI